MNQQILLVQRPEGFPKLSDFQLVTSPLPTPAAEVEFASEAGKKYQVQRVSDLTGTWLNMRSVTNGTGNNISMTVSTRSGGTQNYFRVVQVP